MKKRIKIIAEAGINHNGNIRLAYKLINKAKFFCLVSLPTPRIKLPFSKDVLVKFSNLSF